MSSKDKFFYKVKHAVAVFISCFRRPGRFSIYNYPRQAALSRLKSAKDGVILDIGCGTRKLSEDVIAVDLNPGKFVDVAANAEHLPFEKETCDGIWMEALLEHVAHPSKVLAEAARVLKPGGWLYVEVPFLQGEHAAPGDYRRWTQQGLLQLFEPWKVDWIDISSGPFSALAYQLRSCLSIMTSFGSNLVYRVMNEAVWSYVVWPIKFLDVVCRRFPYSNAHAFGYAVMLTKMQPK